MRNMMLFSSASLSMLIAGCIETNVDVGPSGTLKDKEAHTKVTFERIYVFGEPKKLYHPLIITPLLCIQYGGKAIEEPTPYGCTLLIEGYQHQWGLTSTIDIKRTHFDPNYYADWDDEITAVEIIDNHFEPKGTTYLYENIQLQDGLLKQEDNSGVYYLSTYPITCSNRADCLYLTDENNFGAIVNLEIVIDGQGGAEIARWY